MTSLRAITPTITRVTIAAAVGAALHMGQGNKTLVDQRAIEFSRAVLNQMEIDGTVISCEGPKDNAPAFLKREKVGTGEGPQVEFIIDPVDGTTPTALGRKDVITALACAPRGCLQVLPDDGYYAKISAGPECRGKISMDLTLDALIERVADAKQKARENLTVMMLDRERHRDLLHTLRTLGVRIILIPDGDIAGAVAPCFPHTGVDLLVGAGAGPEATISATAVKCLGGTMFVKVWRDAHDDPERMARLALEGVNVNKVYSEADLVKGNELVFAASGVTKGELIDGVKFTSQGAIVHSLSVRLPSGTLEESKTLLRFTGHPVYDALF